MTEVSQFATLTSEVRKLLFRWVVLITNPREVDSFTFLMDVIELMVKHGANDREIWQAIGVINKIHEVHDTTNRAILSLTSDRQTDAYDVKTLRSFIGNANVNYRLAYELFYRPLKYQDGINESVCFIVTAIATVRGRQIVRENALGNRIEIPEGLFVNYLVGEFYRRYAPIAKKSRLWIVFDKTLRGISC